ncbi:hypothetical protein JCGZ_10024 [Jatropha curcas]|uniref:Cytochrome P450 n=1 Tax=Jatropha curcas TaxID=180498 RepID=A0A067LNY3_JATCU|nr:hypothetical protein JCGZ_10024 [Jatropha curcas]
MKFFLYLQVTLYTILLAIIPIFLAIKVKHIRNEKNENKPPELAGSWSVIGHLHFLGRSNQLLHRVFGSIAEELGPIFFIRLGIHKAVVISNWELAKQCFTTNDKLFLTRPKSLAAKIMGYNHAILGLAPYGQYWRDMRKLAVVELLSNRRLELLKHVWDTETKFFIKHLYQISVKNGGCAVVEMKDKFNELAMNIIVKMIAGKRSFGSYGITDQDSRRFSKALADFFRLAGLLLVSDAIPFLGWLDSLMGYVGEMKRTAREIDSALGKWVKEHRERGLKEVLKGRIKISSMLCFLSWMMSLILGGNDTTMITLTWALSLLLSNRNVLKKAQEEIEIHVGKHHQVKESHIKNLVYLQAIVNETLRLNPAAPLSAPREAMEDCTIAGFHIPAGTRLFVNLWKLHRDPSIWKNPSEFQPERFLNEHANLDVRGQDFEYLPFSSGRRMCPGVSLALRVLHLTLARLLHGFELGTVSDTPVDMSESPGMTVPKAKELEVVLRPRLPAVLYEC